MKFNVSIMLFSLIIAIVFASNDVMLVVGSKYTYPKGSLPCKLHNYTDMDCSYRQLARVPPLYDNIIRSLDLSNNRLGNITGYSPFKQLASLKILSLSNSQITRIDNETFLGLKSLLSLNMSGNPLGVIYDMPFQWLQSLQTLDISCDSAPGECVYDLVSSAFAGISNLEWLDLHENSLSMLHDEIFTDLKRLIYLDITSNTFNDFPSQALSHLSSVQTINASRSYMEHLHFASDFQNLTKLLELNLLDNDFHLHNDTFEMFSSIPLQTLRLDTRQSGDALVYKTLRNVIHFESSLNCLHSFSAVPIFHSPLEHISLSSINDQTINAATFQCLLQSNISMRYLEVIDTRRCSDNGLTNLQNNTFYQFSNLLKLRLSNNHLSWFPKGAFNGLYKLQELDLSSNDICTLSQEAFQIFNKSDSLVYLDLSNNNIAFLIDCNIIIAPMVHLNLASNPMEMIDCLDKVITDMLLNIIVLNLENIKPDVQYGFQLLNKVNCPILPSFLQLKAPIQQSEGSNQPYLKAYHLCQVTTHIEYIDISNWMLWDAISYCIGNCSPLKYLDISGVNLFEYKQTTVYFPSLETLKLARNSIHYISQISFIKTQSLRSLDLSHNSITFINSSDASIFINLSNLNLESNQITSVDWFHYLDKIQTINIAMNLVSLIPKSFLVKNKSLSTLYASGNPFDCSPCTVRPFQSWILHDNYTWLRPNQMYQCSDHISVTAVNSEYCKYLIEIYLAASIVGLALLSSVIIITVKYRWHIKYKLFLIFHKRRYQRVLNNDDEADEDDDIARGLAPIHYRRHDAYVVYAPEDEAWVNNELEVNIEDGPEPFELCMKERGDIPPGRFLLESVCHGITHSRRTIVVLSKHFMANGMCHFQLNVACMRLIKEGLDVLILIYLEDIPDKDKTLLLRQILCSDKAILKWPHDNVGRDLFWQILREELKMPVIVNRQYEL